MGKIDLANHHRHPTLTGGTGTKQFSGEKDCRKIQRFADEKNEENLGKLEAVQIDLGE
ncbi:hypothetical protein GCM10028807_24550 [Spirosoma daeguense]